MRAVFASVAMLLAAAQRIAEAAPHGTRLTYFDNPATTIAVSWNSDDQTDGQVIYGTNPSSLTTSAIAVRTSQAAPLNNSFTARLIGLSPNTTYYYRVGGAGGAFHPAGDPFQFTTRSDDPCDAFRFILLGDNRADFDGMGANVLWSDILAEAMAQSPHFFVNTGDMVKNGDRADEWISFVDDSEAGWALSPSILTMGNHDQDDVDGDGAIYNQLYEHPRNSATATEDYYSIDIGPIHFVSLNSQFNSTGSTDMTTMVSWLQADLVATSQPWKIVFFHKAVYSRGNHHTGEENSGSINQQFVPLFDAHDVDMVFNGHSHDYERYAPSVGVDSAFGGTGRMLPAGPGSTFAAGGPVPDGRIGTTYLVSGGAGALTTEFMGLECQDASCTYCTGFNIACDSSVFDRDQEATVVYEGRHNYAIVSVDADTISVDVWVTDAGNAGGAEMIDSFSMTKSPFSIVCGSPPRPDAGVGTPDSGSASTDASGDPSDAAGNRPDSGDPGAGSPSSGCGCQSSGRGGSAAPCLAFLLATVGFVRRRVRRRPKGFGNVKQSAHNSGTRFVKSSDLKDKGDDGDTVDLAISDVHVIDTNGVPGQVAAHRCAPQGHLRGPDRGNTRTTR